MPSTLSATFAPARNATARTVGCRQTVTSSDYTDGQVAPALRRRRYPFMSESKNVNSLPRGERR